MCREWARSQIFELVQLAAHLLNNPGRAEMIAFAEKNGIPVSATAQKPYSTDRNLLHISYESGVLEDPWFDASGPEMRDMYKLSVAPEDAPNEAE